MKCYNCVLIGHFRPRLLYEEKFEKGGFILKMHRMFSVHTIRRRNLKTQQYSPVILDLCLRKTQTEKSYDYRNVIVFEKLRFQNVFRLH